MQAPGGDMADDDFSQIRELYARLRSQVEHENNLYNQRIVWLISMQAFLFATVGLLLQARYGKDAIPANAGTVDAFTALICVLGLSVAAISGRLLTNARGALAHLGKVWDTHASRMPDELASFYPHVSGGDGKSTSAIWLRSGNLPGLFIVSWIVAAGILLWQPLFSLVKPEMISSVLNWLHFKST